MDKEEASKALCVAREGDTVTIFRGENGITLDITECETLITFLRQVQRL